ncbi:MAG: hypothetical protein K2H82_09295 [Oscillospiraceae bacterium]|nr:hypothetical protein [Oscillospiraceae bacterium]
MIDKQKVYNLLGRHIGFCESSFSGMDPDSENEFWLPMIEELSKDIDETIAFMDELDQTEFEYTLEILDELIEKTQSHKLLEVIRRIGTEKNINKTYFENSIERASCLFDD